MVAGDYGNYPCGVRYVIVTVICVSAGCVVFFFSSRFLANVVGLGVTDFLVTIPFSFLAERWGARFVLWCNLVPRVGMSVWAVVIGEFVSLRGGRLDRGADTASGHYRHVLPTRAIVAGPFLAVLGGECVFQSTIFTLTSALSSSYVQR